MDLQDWHPADIIAGLKRKEHHLPPFHEVQACLAPRWQTRCSARGRKAKLIADAMGISPEIIWPSRYFDEVGNPVHRHTRSKSDHPYTVTHNPTIAIVVLANDDRCHSPAL